MKDNVSGAKHLAGNITFIYALFSSFWIFCSDKLLELLTNDSNRLTQLQTLKGWTFVLLTSGVLYALVRRGVRSLEASYNLLQAVTQGTTEAIFVKDLDGRYLTINPAGARILGTSVEDAIGKDHTELLPPEIARQIREEDSRVISSGQSQTYENVLLVAGTPRTYLSTKHVYRDARGNPIGLIGITRDITEYKQLLEELKREKEDLAALSSVTANSISTLDLEELLNVLLQRIANVMGADAAVILLKKDNDLYVRASVGIDAESRSHYAVSIGQGFAGTIAATMQPLYIDVSGDSPIATNATNGTNTTEDAQTDSRVMRHSITECRIRTMLGVPLKRDSHLVGVLHVDWLSIHPVSDCLQHRAQRERELHLLEITAERCTMAILNAQLYEQTKHLQERLQLQIDSMPIGCIVNDAQMRVTDWNPAAEKIFGFTKEEALGKEPCQLITPTTVRPLIDKLYGQLAAGERTVDSVNENVTKEGRTIICEWHNAPLKEADGTVVGMLSMAQDITERSAAEKALRDSEQRYRVLFESNPHPMWVYDLETLAFLAVNDAAIHHYGYSGDEFLAMKATDIRHPEEIPAFLKKVSQISSGLDVARVWRHRKKDGTIIEVESTSHPLVFSGRRAVVVLVNDITERRQAEQELRRKDELYRTLARNFPNGAVFLVDRNLRYILAEGAELTAMGLTSESFEGKTIWEALSLEMSEMLEPVYRQALDGTATTFEVPYGDQIYLMQILPVTNSSGDIYAGMAVTQNISDRKRAEAQLRRYAFYEPLTGLPNRTLFLERLEQQIERAKRGEAGLFAVLLLQLDRYQMVKYSLGHRVAERLVIGTARRLEECLEPTDLIACLGSDEFAILLRNVQSISDATRIADRIQQDLTIPFDLDEREVFPTLNIGIALSCNENATNTPLYERPEDFLRAADMAMHHAKMQGSACHAVFDPAMQERAVARLQLEADLRRAIERQQFQVYYQPIVSLETDNITGFEALVRWIHPTRGMVSPAEFIPLAEETGLIGFIDWWVLREACTQLNLWQQEFARETPLTMSVNLSGVQLGQLGLIERLDQVLRETGIDGGCLKLEITESVLMKNAACAAAMLEQLKALGVQLSIDDFGTGYSSLARLNQLPIDTLKIDRSFVSRMGKDSESLEIVRAIVTLAHTLEMDVIAEGTETAQELAQLRSLECEYGQGYFFSRPVDSHRAGELLAAQLE